jgi:multidrug efflux pump subunit AcrA (membrane-fusion protein)
MAIAILNQKRWTTGLTWAAVALVALLLMAYLLHDTLFHGRPDEGPSASASGGGAGPESKAMALPTSVSLTEGKWKTADIKTEPAQMMKLSAEVGVAGRIEANIDRQVEVRPRANGVVREVRALLGQKVKKGDVLVVLDSPDIGTARLNLHNRQRELLTVRTEAEWKNEIAVNVARLIPELRALIPATEPEDKDAGHALTAGQGHMDEHHQAELEKKYAELVKKYANRPLGANRGTLLEAYANFEIAHHENEKTSGLYRQKIVGEHPAFLAKHTEEAVQARFEAALEQVRFDANQQKLIADQQVKNAEATVIDAAQRLRILGVAEDIEELLAHPEKVLSAAADQDVTGYTIVAPFDGTITIKHQNAVPSQKAEMNDVLFTLTDLSNVWVMANVPESEFASLHALRGGTVRVTATAYPDRSFEARLLSIGAMVDPTTRTVPILAETANPDDMLKLGMFVRIVLGSATSEELLVVPAGAVVEIENQKGVFLPEEHGKEPHTYNFRPVKLGRDAGDRQVIATGLSRGELVVSSGAFFLKSELILQNETEED